MALRAFRGRSLVPAGRAAEEPRGILWAIGLVALYIALTIPVYVVAYFAGFRGTYGEDIQKWPYVVHVVLGGSAQILALVAVLGFRRWTGVRTAGEPAPAGRAAFSGLVAAVAILPVLIGVSLLQAWTYGQFGREFRGQDLVRNAFAGDRATFAAVAVFAVLVAPPFEEFVFRRLVYGGLRARLGVFVATLVSAGLFAVWHLEPDAFPGTFVLGLAFAHLRERTGGLTAPIAMHACYNALQVTGILTARLGG